MHRVKQGNAELSATIMLVERARQLEAARQAAVRTLMSDKPSMSRRRKCTLPFSFCSVPQMQLTSVLLPEPFGPISPSRSPSADAEIDTVERDEAAEMLAQLAYLQQRRGHAFELLRPTSATRPTMPPGATMTNPISSNPTISRFIADEIVTVATC